MKYIEVTEKEIIRHRINRIPVIEITSFNQLQELKIGTEVAIMNSCEMVLGKIQSKNDDLILVWDNQGMISVKQSSFQYGNYMYQIL